MDFNVKDSWRDVVDPENPQRMVYRDEGCNYLTDETKHFFCGLGLECVHGYIWSWPDYYPLDKHYYHTDWPTGKAQVAINYLLSGDSGTTEWLYPHRARVADGVQVSQHGYRYKAYEPDVCDVSVSLEFGKVMMARIDIPHRVRVEKTNKTRVSYSLRMKTPTDKYFVKWGHAVNILQPFLAAPN